MVSVDFLGAVASFPMPDDKIRTTDLKVLCHLLAAPIMAAAASVTLPLLPRFMIFWELDFLLGASGYEFPSS